MPSELSDQIQSSYMALQRESMRKIRKASYQVKLNMTICSYTAVAVSGHMLCAANICQVSKIHSTSVASQNKSV